MCVREGGGAYERQTDKLRQYLIEVAPKIVKRSKTPDQMTSMKIDKLLRLTHEAQPSTLKQNPFFDETVIPYQV